MQEGDRKTLPAVPNNVRCCVLPVLDALPSAALLMPHRL